MDNPSQIRKDPDTGLYVNIPARIREIFRENRFFRFMDIRLDDVSCGHCRIHMDTVHDRHANHRNVVHGGVITAVSNAVLALTAVTVGLRARTLSSNVVFIRNIDFDSTIYAEGFVEHLFGFADFGAALDLDAIGSGVDLFGGLLSQLIEGEFRVCDVYSLVEYESQVKCLFEICGDGLKLLVRSNCEVGLIEGVFDVV